MKKMVQNGQNYVAGTNMGTLEKIITQIRLEL